MGRLRIVNAPLLVLQTIQFGAEAGLGLIEGKLLGDSTLAETIAVTQTQADGISTFLVVLIARIIQCRIGGTIETPDGIDTFCLGEAHLNLVGFLINRHREVLAFHGGDTSLVCSIKFIGRAGGYCQTSHQNAHCILKYLFHNFQVIKLIEIL